MKHQLFMVSLNLEVSFTRVLKMEKGKIRVYFFHANFFRKCSVKTRVYFFAREFKKKTRLYKKFQQYFEKYNNILDFVGLFFLLLN